MRILLRYVLNLVYSVPGEPTDSHVILRPQVLLLLLLLSLLLLTTACCMVPAAWPMLAGMVYKNSIWYDRCGILLVQCWLAGCVCGSCAVCMVDTKCHAMASRMHPKVCWLPVRPVAVCVSECEHTCGTENCGDLSWG